LFLLAGPLLGILAGMWRGIGRIPTGPPDDVVIRYGVDDTLWNLVRHLNSYRHSDEDTAAAVRGLLWALAHTDDRAEHQELVVELAQQFRGWSEHPPEVLRAATSQVWQRIGFA
jgi:hypothetical protein